MKTSLLLLVLASLLYYYFQNNPVPRHASPGDSVAEEAPRPAYQTNPAEGIVIAAIPSYSERWKIGDKAQTSLKSGPNAQTDFAPFVPVVTPTPSNRPSGYTSVSGVSLRR